MQPSFFRRYRATQLIIVVAATELAFGASQTFALDNDKITLFGSVNESYDDNVFRLPDNASSGTNRSRDEFNTIFGVGLRADMPYGRQRVVGNLNANHYGYARNSSFNYYGGNGSLDWLWRLGNDANGDLGYSYSRSQQSFAYLQQPIRNIVTSHGVRLSGSYALDTRWTLDAGTSLGQGRNSNSGFQLNDSNSASWNFGARYITPRGTYTGLRLTRTSVEFPNKQFVQGSFFDNAYSDTNLSMIFNWQLSGASRFDGSVGYTKRDHDNLSQRDFDGYVYSVGWTWSPTGRTSVNTQFRRDLGGWEDLTTTYVRTYVFTVTPAYQLTGKIGLNSSVQYLDQEYFGNAGFSTVFTDGRHDKTWRVSLGMTYQATRTLQFTAGASHSERTSNRTSGDFEDNTISASAQLAF